MTGTDGSLLRRLTPTLVGLLVFAVLAALHALAPATYIAILRAVGTDPWSHPFIDSEFMYNMKNAWMRGIDIYQGVPDDVIPGNKMAYSPLWPRLPFLSADRAFTNPVGVATDLLFLLSIACLPPARTALEATLLSFATVSTMVFFALERNNIDVWIYLLVVGGAVVATRGVVGRAVSYALFTAAALLKYYPLTLLWIAWRERLRGMILVVFGYAIVLGAFIGWFWPEIRQQLQAIPRGWAFGDMVGIVNLPRAAGAASGDSGLRPAIELGLRLLLTLVVLGLGLRRASSAPFALAMRSMPEAPRLWLAVGSLVMGGCYLAGPNVGYRGIYLVIVLAGLLALRRASVDPALRRALMLRAVAIPVLMWMEGLRLWTRLVAGLPFVPPGLGRAAQVGVWLLRELLWLDLACLMLAAIFAFALQSPCGAWDTMRAAWTRRRLALRT